MDLNKYKAVGMALALCAAAGLAVAKLPPPTAQQLAEQAAKKAQADAQAEKDKQRLLASIDALAARWRGKAAEDGLTIHPPTPLAAPTAAVTAPATQSGSSGQPGGERGAAALAAPVTSEKHGTAAPSEDVKKAPSPPPLPAGRRF